MKLSFKRWRFQTSTSIPSSLSEKSLGRWDSLFLNKPLNEQVFFATPMYHDLGEMLRLTFHTLHHIHFSSLQNLLLLKMDKQHSIIHARVHPFFYHTHHCLSQQFWREMGCWNTSKETCALCIFCPNQDRKSKYYILLECSTFNAFDTSFPTSAIRTYPNTHFLLQSQCTLSITTFFCTCFSHWALVINSKDTIWKCFTFIPRLIFDYWGWP